MGLNHLRHQVEDEVRKVQIFVAASENDSSQFSLIRLPCREHALKTPNIVPNVWRALAHHDLKQLGGYLFAVGRNQGIERGNDFVLERLRVLSRCGVRGNEKQKLEG